MTLGCIEGHLESKDDMGALEPTGPHTGGHSESQNDMDAWRSLKVTGAVTYNS